MAKIWIDANTIFARNTAEEASNDFYDETTKGFSALLRKANAAIAQENAEAAERRARRERIAKAKEIAKSAIDALEAEEERC